MSFVDMPKLVALRILNKINMDRIIQVNTFCANVVDHIADEIKIKIFTNIIENERKLCININESTTLSKKNMLAICLRCAIGDSHEMNDFFDIIMLNSTSTEIIKNCYTCVKI